MCSFLNEQYTIEYSTARLAAEQSETKFPLIFGCQPVSQDFRPPPHNFAPRGAKILGISPPFRKFAPL
jgi:hypothetical protein